MIAINSLDQDLIQEIARRQQKMEVLLKLAQFKEDTHLFVDALMLYQKARPLSYYVGKCLKVTVQIEECDLTKWHWINDKIEGLKFKIGY
ncbi:hypothetical protein [Legionella fairfieldensis]|uniref:hypothetical protein n=1 Tax=Legionella fairfieldensis TaxID=45064 RepID=UPI00048A8E15|nr:hypothetical protein [Legionella fairfieldensis]